MTPTLLQTIILAVIQGVSELFPVSSVAHAVLTPWAFGWDLGPEFLKDHFLPLVVALHLGTALALLVFFRKDWIDFAGSAVSGRQPEARAELIRVIIGTIPAALIGLVFEKQLRSLFSNIDSAALFLILNGMLLFVGERLRGRGTRELADLSYLEALLVGLAQSLALVPGFSRSGASIVAGFWAGLRHEAAARYSMLLATPIIAGASIVELPKLFHGADSAILVDAVIGGVVAGGFAYLTVWALMVWFRRHEIHAMAPFAIYCWVVGAVVLAFAA